MYPISIKIKNYKCFKEESGFDTIERVNLIIGKNNSGKSSLLDLIHAVTTNNYSFDKNTWKNNNEPIVVFESQITKEVIRNTFSQSISGGKINKNSNHLEYGLKYEGRTIKWSKQSKDDVTLIDCDDSGIIPKLLESGVYSSSLPKNITIPLTGEKIPKIAC